MEAFGHCDVSSSGLIHITPGLVRSRHGAEITSHHYNGGW